MANGRWLLFFCHFLVAVELKALGIGASPGVIRFRKVPLGKRVIASERIVVRNPNPYDSWYRFRLREEKSHPYFEPVPSVEWISIEKESVFAPANGISEGVEVSVCLPEGYEYYNRHYAGTIVVAPAKTGGIGAGIAIIVEIETEPIRIYPYEMKSVPFVYPTYLCASGIDSFYLVNDKYGRAEYEVSRVKDLAKKEEKEFGAYERELFFLYPFNHIAVSVKMKKVLYEIGDEVSKGAIVTVDRVGDDSERGFTKIEKCR